MNAPNLHDYHWLLSEKAARWLSLACRANVELVAMASRLRKELTPARVHLVLEQAELRRKAREKFTAAANMFFTPLGLQQATGETIATYKAARFPSGQRCVDLCCGLGGDLAALAGRGPAVGVDRDPVAALFARANCAASGCGEVDVLTQDVADVPLEEFAAWHIDPDRRPAGRRTTRPELHDPPLNAIQSMLARNPNAAVKLAPAAEAPPDWAERAELQWIGHRRECKQLVAWHGNLALRPGRRAATLLQEGAPARTVVGAGDAFVPISPAVGRFIFEPHAAVLAAGLGGELASEHGLSAVAAGVAYLTGDAPLRDPALAAFEVDEVLPFDVRRVKAALRQRGIGRLEVKKRGVADDPAVVAQRLRVKGEKSAVLILSPFAGRVVAVLARRVKSEE